MDKDTYDTILRCLNWCEGDITLCNCGRDDCPDCDFIPTIIQDIQEARFHLQHEMSLTQDKHQFHTNTIQ